MSMTLGRLTGGVLKKELQNVISCLQYTLNVGLLALPLVGEPILYSLLYYRF